MNDDDLVNTVVCVLILLIMSVVVPAAIVLGVTELIN